MDGYFVAAPAEELPLAIPVAIEISSDLVPADTRPEAWPFLGTDLPEMRKRIEQDTGVVVPGVRIRDGGASNPAQFRVLVNEIPVATELVPGGDGAVERLRGVTERLRILLLPHLSEFVGLQEVENRLQSWSEQPGLAALIARTMPNPSARVLFTRVVQTLLREQVPLTRPHDVLEGVQDAGLGEDPAACVRAVRLRLRDLLPGNASGTKRIPLPPELEESIAVWTWEDRGRAFLAAPPEEVQDWITRLRELLSTSPPTEGEPSQVLVTEAWQTRAMLQRLLAFEFPNCPTLSREESAGEAESTADRPRPET